MAENTSIEWATHTFNPWRGCQKIAPGCKFCYAEKLVNGRMQGDFSRQRVKLSDAGWREPLKWNRDAEPESIPMERPRVFCASLADVFEDWQGDVLNHHGKRLWVSRCIGKNDRPAYFPETPQGDFSQCRPATLDDLRRDLFELIDATPNLDWLILTKRPENVRRMWQPKQFPSIQGSPSAGDFLHRKNVWLLTSVSDQATADAAIPELLKCRDLAPVLGVSYEPALGPVDFTRLNNGAFETYDALRAEVTTPHNTTKGGRHSRHKFRTSDTSPLDWIIVGGESGSHARPFDVQWARSTIEQCRAAGVPCFVKQLGAKPINYLRFEDKKGGDIETWPAELRVRQFPKVEVPA